MPEYLWYCPKCDTHLSLDRPMNEVGATILCRCTGLFRRVYQAPAFLDRPTAPAILGDPISAGYPGSKFSGPQDIP